NDRLYRCCQRSITIRWAASAEQAVEAAKEQFSKLEDIRLENSRRSDRSGVYRDGGGTRDPAEIDDVLRIQKISLAGRSPMSRRKRSLRHCRRADHAAARRAVIGGGAARLPSDG